MGLFRPRRRVEWRATHYLLGVLPVATWTGSKAHILKTAFATKHRFGGRVVVERVSTARRPSGRTRGLRITL